MTKINYQRPEADTLEFVSANVIMASQDDKNSLSDWAIDEEEDLF